MPLLRKKTFDLLLLDLMMPIMGGQDTLRWIRQTPSLQEFQVIVLSGENDCVPGEGDRDSGTGTKT